MSTATTDARLTFFVASRLSDKLSLTPAGFLLCTDVSVAKTGPMVYGPGETDIETGSEGYATVECEAEELFRPATLASANAAPIVDEHPDNEDRGVNAENWRDLAKGVALNARQQGEELYLDLLIQDQSLIETVLGLRSGEWEEVVTQPERFEEIAASNRGKREISLGYIADYVPTGPGRGKKVDIVINHVAVVASGRCGQRCRITDSVGPGTRRGMKSKTIDRFLKRWKDAGGNEEGLKKTLEETDPKDLTGDAEPEGGEGHHTHIHLPETGDARSKFTDEELEKRFAGHEENFKKINDSLEEIKGKLPQAATTSTQDDGEKVEEKDGYLVPKAEGAAPKAGDAGEEERIEGELEEEAPEGVTGDKARHATDSAYLVESFNETKAVAEIIAPGVRLPTFDARWNPKLNYTNMCRLRRAALVQGLDEASTAELIRGVRRKTTDSAALKKLTCDSIRTLFFTVGQLKRQANNQGGGSMTHDHGYRRQEAAGPMTSIADLNKRNAEFYRSQS